jgi:16S rRNA (cytidine1402-2'-O)-methyltransferase
MFVKGKLYLIPSLLFPQTGQKVLPPFVPACIKNITHFLVENERSARRFISSLGQEIVIENLNFTILDKDTKAESLKSSFDLLKQGIDFGVISEAGCPGIADPGSLAVHLAHLNEIEVVPLVGPSSILLALMGSGFSGQKFTFLGYLPIEKTERQKAIKNLENEAKSKLQTQIFIETPYRNNQLIADILQICQPQTQLCIASEITSPQQFLHTKSIQSWRKAILNLDFNKKPTVFLIF